MENKKRDEKENASEIVEIPNYFGTNEEPDIATAKKIELDKLIRLSISDLKHNGLLEERYNSGVFEFVQGHTKNIIGIEVKIASDEKYVRFMYSKKEQNGEREYDYRVCLETTPCNYGGVRYWFYCPFCPRVYVEDYERRARTLYFYNSLFVCRHCFRPGHTYRIRNLSGWSKQYGIVDMAKVELDFWDTRWRTYAGKPTKRHKKIVTKWENAHALADEFNKHAQKRFEKRCKKIRKLKESDDWS